jgi:hypothetical protein
VNVRLLLDENLSPIGSPRSCGTRTGVTSAPTSTLEPVNEPEPVNVPVPEPVEPRPRPFDRKVSASGYASVARLALREASGLYCPR